MFDGLLQPTWSDYLEKVNKINQYYRDDHLTYWERYQMLLEAVKPFAKRPTQEEFCCDLIYLPSGVRWMRIHPRIAQTLIESHESIVLCEIVKVATHVGIVFGYALFQMNGQLEADTVIGEATARNIFKYQQEEVLFYCPENPNIPTYYQFQAMSFADRLFALGRGRMALTSVRVVKPIASASLLVSIPGTGQSISLPPLQGMNFSPEGGTVLFGEIQAAYQNALQKAHPNDHIQLTDEDQGILAILGIAVNE